MFLTVYYVLGTVLYSSDIVLNKMIILFLLQS